MIKSGYCGKIIKPKDIKNNCQKYHKECYKKQHKEYTKKFMHGYNRRSYVMARRRISSRLYWKKNHDKILKKQREYNKNPKNKARIKAYQKKYFSKPEIKSKMREKYRKKMLEYVKVPMLNNMPLQEGNKLKMMPSKEKKVVRSEYIYCDGMAKEIQKQVPKMMDEIALKLLNEEEKK